MNRIEERVESVKGMYFSDRCQFCHELGEKVEPFLCEDCRQEIFDWVNSKGWAIHQVPQPLDDKELRKSVTDIALTIWREEMSVTKGINQLLALLQPKIDKLQEKIQTTNVYYLREIQNNKVEHEAKIEEARQQMVRKIKDELEKCGWFVNMGDGRWGERKLAWRNFWKRYTGQALSGKGGE